MKANSKKQVKAAPKTNTLTHAQRSKIARAAAMKAWKTMTSRAYTKKHPRFAKIAAAQRKAA